MLTIACGPLLQGDDGGGQQGQTQETTQAPSGAVASVDDVEKATVYIQAAGGVFDQGRQFGESSVGQGSGFIIDPSGLAVTNNHVVAGAGFLEVYVNGEDEPRDAKVLGRSECSDLALIDIDEGGFDYLEWRDGEISSNLDVTATGFPAEDEDLEERIPDYTVTRGIINTTEASGDTQWASVDSVLEHDAMLQGGNSGGPLVDEEGKAVGVNYAERTDPETGAGTGQQFAIAQQDAQDIVAELKNGDVDSIGINGIAYGDPDLSGIAVVSAVTGSPAANVGVSNFAVNEADPTLPQELDIITKLEGTTLGENGTMEEYCNVLRGRGSPDQPLSMEVLRSAFDEAGEPTSVVRYEGVLNGGPEGKLKPVETLLGASSEGQTGDTGSSSSSDYAAASDDSGAITVEAPTSWSQIDGRPGPIFDGEENGPALTVAPDVEGFNNSYATPGVDIRVSSSVLATYDQNTVLDGLDRSGQCELVSNEQDAASQVAVNYWANCGGVEGQEVFDTAIVDPNGAYLVLVQIQLVGEADSAAVVERIVGSLDINF